MKEFSTCPHLSVCSGCAMPFFETSEPPVWQRAKKWLPEGARLFCDARRGWRMKAKLAVRGASQKPQIGLFRKQSHNVVSIPECMAHHPSINLARGRICDAIAKCGVEPYDEAMHSKELRYVQLFVCRRTGKVQLVLVVKEIRLAKLLASALWEQTDLWHSIWINVQPHRTNRILSDEWIHCYGPLYLEQRIGRAEIAFHPGAFSQAHLNLFDRLLDTVEEWVAPGSRLLEIYAGAGGISSHLSSRLQEALLIEDNPYAFASFEQSPVPSHLRYLQADATAAIPFLASYDLILVDPPRKGLAPSLLQALQRLERHTMIMISCSFESFQRDAAALLAAGWTMRHAAGFWLFPGTDEIELAVKWVRDRSL